jgi:hypothetical protein
MSARLYANENFHREVVVLLRELGYDVLTTLDAGKSYRKIPDEKVVEYATEQSRAVLTFNRRDFIQLHKELGESHAGIIVCHLNPDLKDLAKRIDEKIRTEGTLAGKLLRVHRSSK